MTAQRKDEMKVPNQKLFDYLHELTGKVFVQSEMNDIIRIIEAEISPPVSDDVAEAVKCLKQCCDGMSCSCLETLIRAASTPSAEVQVLSEDDFAFRYNERMPVTWLNLARLIARDYPQGIKIEASKSVINNAGEKL